MFRSLLLTAALGLAALASQAQSPSTGGPTPQDPTTPPDPTAIPLDGGASLLLAGGVAYGLRRLGQRRRA